MCENSQRFACIDGFAEELAELSYEGMSNWVISFRSPFTVYSAHFSYLLVFFFVIICGLLSYRHSLENGQKYTLFWWGAFIHGLLSERGTSSSKYWHAQAPIMFFGKQLPLHILFYYPSIIYLAMMAIQRLKLNIWSESAAVGILVMLMDIPFRMISVKFLHITYHDTDAMYLHKMSGVPWTEIFSALLLATSYVAVYHGAQYLASRNTANIWNNSKPTKDETAAALASGIVSPFFGFLQKIVFLHFFNDFFNVNPISCLIFTVSVYLTFVLVFVPTSMKKHEAPDTVAKQYLFYELVVFVVCILFLALFGKPQKEVSIGRHEPVGNCTAVVCARSPLGKEIERMQYLCPHDLDNRPFSLYGFHGHPNDAPSLNTIWYTICGTPFRNRIHFLLLNISFVTFFFAIYLRTIFPKALPRRRKKYLCAEEIYGRKFFLYNFGCLEEGAPCSNSIWYTICGSPLCNRAQFFLNAFSFLLTVSSFYIVFLFVDLEILKPIKEYFKKTGAPTSKRNTEAAPEQPSEQEQSPPEEPPQSTAI